MTDYDKGTAALIADLEALPPSYDRDVILERARKLRYHDYHPNGYTLPQMMLHKHLNAAGFKELALNVEQGKYDQSHVDAERWAASEDGQRTLGVTPPPEEQDSSPNPDDEEQQRVRALGRQLATTMQDAGVGGVILSCSQDCAAWTFAFPPWGGLQPDPETGQLRIRLKTATAEDKATANATLHMLTSLRELSAEINTVFNRLYAQVEAKLAEQGYEMPTRPAGLVGPSGKQPKN